MKYGVILADPPWRYECNKGQGVAEDHYQTMSLDEIKALPIGDLAAPDSALFLWICPPLLPEGLEVVKAWGFQYKTKAFNWVKRYKSGALVLGLGHYTRANSEDCLLAIKGRPRVKTRDVAQIIWEDWETETLLTERRQHSRKPDEQYDRIMRLFDGPYLELFARRRWPGWDVWGNEVESTVQIEPVFSPHQTHKTGPKIDDPGWGSMISREITKGRSRGF